MEDCGCLEIVVGTYEAMLVGYRVEKGGSNYTMKQSFTNNSHCGCIKSIAASQRHLASGGTDETVKLFNIRSRAEVGSLLDQIGSINCLEFHGNNFLFSGSEDGSICVWKAGSWQCLKTLTGHKSSVTALAIHPSGKLALSLSKDRTLKTWNLIKGRAAFTTNIKAVGEFVRWSFDGTLYAVVISNRVDIYDVQTAGIIHSIDFGRRINCVSFLTNDILVVAGDGENIELHSARKNAILGILSSGCNRIKAVNVVNSPEGETHRWLITSSSDGSIKIWDLDMTSLDDKPRLVAMVETGCRITCQAVLDLSLNTGLEGGEEVEKIDQEILKNDEETIAISTEAPSKRKIQPTVEDSQPKQKKKKLKTK